MAGRRVRHTCGWRIFDRADDATQEEEVNHTEPRSLQHTFGHGRSPQTRRLLPQPRQWTIHPTDPLATWGGYA